MLKRTGQGAQQEATCIHPALLDFLAAGRTDAALRQLEQRSPELGDAYVLGRWDEATALQPEIDHLSADVERLLVIAGASARRTVATQLERERVTEIRKRSA